MNTSTIRKLLKTYKCFKGVFASDMLPYSANLPLNIIVNTDPSYKPGQHWVAISIDAKGHGYYFDSFGFPPLVKNIFKFISEKAFNGWSYNRRQLQNVMSSTCGNYCVLFIIFKCNNLSNKEFFFNFGRDTAKNDTNMLKIFKNFSFVKKFASE